MKAIKKIIYQKRSKHLVFVSLLMIFVVTSCEYEIGRWEREVDYTPKTIKGNVSLPDGSTIDESSLKIESVYDHTNADDQSFSLSVESANVQQILYASDNNDNVFLMGYINSTDKKPKLNAESTATALILTVLQVSHDDPDEWDQLVNKIQRNKYFDAVVEEVEQLIIDEKDVLSEDNRDLMLAIGELIGNMTNALEASLKSAMLEDLDPLIVKTKRDIVYITSNGKSPLYQITVTKEGKEIARKDLLAADPLKISVGNILTWKWGALIPPSDVAFRINKGSYEFTASSLSADGYFTSPRFKNAVLVVNHILGATGFPLSVECTKIIADFMYGFLVGTVMDALTNGTSPSDAVRLTIDYMYNSATKIGDLIANCDGDGEKTSEKVASYTSKFAKAAKFGLKCLDVMGKFEGGTNAGALLGFWAGQPKTISFCKTYDGKEVLSCDAGRFNLLHCNLKSSKDFYTYKDAIYGLSQFDIGSSSYVPTYSSFTSTKFEIRAKSEWDDSFQFKAVGIIKDQIITNMSITASHESFIDGHPEKSGTKRLVLNNLDISLNDISTKEDTYFDIEYSNPSEHVTSFYEIEKFWSVWTESEETAYETNPGYDHEALDSDGVLSITLWTKHE